MGGPLKHVEPRNNKELEQDKDIWGYFFNEGLHPYIMAIKDDYITLSTMFSNSWRKGYMEIGSNNIFVMLDLISEVMSQD